eukprot:SAG11_NODE_7292_length_1165_cov_1.985929_2_plen_120_part_01
MLCAVQSLQSGNTHASLASRVETHTCARARANIRFSNPAPTNLIAMRDAMSFLMLYSLGARAPIHEASRDALATCSVSSPINLVSCQKLRESAEAQRATSSRMLQVEGGWFNTDISDALV